MKTVNYTKTVLTVLISALGTLSIYSCDPGYRDSAAEKQIYVNKKSLSIFVGDRVQLTASPDNVKFTWLSEDVAVATVNSEGMVEAVGEGSTNIVASQGEIRTKIATAVGIRVPMTGIVLDKTVLTMSAGESTKVNALPVPENATEVSLQWMSENPAIAAVSRGGTVEAISAGLTKIAAYQGDIKQSLSVMVLKKLTGLSVVSVSDERPDDGGGKNTILDGNGNTYWHSMWSPNMPLPHWIIVDLGATSTFARLSTQRRSNGDTKAFEYWVNDNSSDPDDAGWRKIATGAWASKTVAHTIINDFEPQTGRYLKLIVTESFNIPHIAIVAVEVYGY